MKDMPPAGSVQEAHYPQFDDSALQPLTQNDQLKANAKKAKNIGSKGPSA